jgi:hypothetical protein
MKESAMISTIMVRTLMDERYYYGIREEAGYVLSKVFYPISLLISVRNRVVGLAW